jgi:hypothetical protein
MTIS